MKVVNLSDSNIINNNFRHYRIINNNWY
jgi:hypothetical protein